MKNNLILVLIGFLFLSISFNGYNVTRAQQGSYVTCEKLKDHLKKHKYFFDQLTLKNGSNWMNSSLGALGNAYVQSYSEYMHAEYREMHEGGECK